MLGLFIEMVHPFCHLCLKLDNKPILLFNNMQNNILRRHLEKQIASFLFDIHDFNSYIANYNNSWTETFQRITKCTYSPPCPFLDMTSFLMLMLFYENH